VGGSKEEEKTRRLKGLQPTQVSELGKGSTCQRNQTNLKKESSFDGIGKVGAGEFPKRIQFGWTARLAF